VALDARGHGESSWAPDSDYSLAAQTRDLVAVLAALPPRPALVGASMGGITALAALGADRPPSASALVLVDVTPKVDMAGAERIAAFMRANPEGFASIEEAADAVARYNPHRPRPRDPSGLRRNLREVDGRLYWHWDPAFLGARRLEPEVYQAHLEAAARKIRLPTLLVRGALSDLVGEAEVAHFRALIPHAQYVDVAGAGHMVAGDRNDAFVDAIVRFLDRVDATAA
jgi:pimeloyl-ACP methyl ester carboxylesterase